MHCTVLGNPNAHNYVNIGFCVIFLYIANILMQIDRYLKYVLCVKFYDYYHSHIFVE